jgi:hypothetical protein
MRDTLLMHPPPGKIFQPEVLKSLPALQKRRGAPLPAAV